MEAPPGAAGAAGAAGSDDRPRPWPGEPDSLIVTTDTGVRLHYLDWGGPDGSAEPLPPLLLIHGLAGTAWTWAPICRRLCGLTRVLALDLRGHGLSESPRSGYDLESLAFDALTVLVANGWGHDAGGPPAVVAGHGLGAMVALTMAAIQPDSICGVALVDGGWEDVGAATGLEPAEFERGLGDPPEVLASMDAFLADRREFDPRSWDSDQERAARATVDEKYAGHVAPVTRAHAMRGTVEAMFAFQPAEALVPLRQPLLVAVAESGSADDESVRERLLALDELAQARLSAGSPSLRVERFPGAGHNVMRYRPDELSLSLGRLLRDAATSARRPGGPA